MFEKSKKNTNASIQLKSIFEIFAYKLKHSKKYLLKTKDEKKTFEKFLIENKMYSYCMQCWFLTKSLSKQKYFEQNWPQLSLNKVVSFLCLWFKNEHKNQGWKFFLWNSS